MKYQTSHPWISFALNLKRLPWEGWEMLGECKSKCIHLAGEILYPETATLLHTVFLSKGVLATAAIEGNTLTEEQVKQIINHTLKLPPSQEYLGEEIKNIIEECNKIAQDIKDGKDRKLDSENIMRMNAAIFNGLTVEDWVQPGKIRSRNVHVGRYLGAPYEDCTYLLQRLCEWLNTDKELNRKDEFEIDFSILKAIIAHIYIAWIHPFGDGNGRTARLVELQILMNVGIPGDAAHLFSNHYNQTRSKYYQQLDQASKKQNEGIINFIMYAIQGFRDGLVQQLEWIKDQQRIVAWENYVHRFFARDKSINSERKKELVLDLTKSPEPLTLSKIKEISTRVAIAYKDLTHITFLRDLTELIEAKLINKNDELYSANKDLILANLPIIKPKKQINSSVQELFDKESE